MIIHNIFTGGTIGSQINKNGAIATDKNCPYKLIEMYKGYNSECDITFVNSEPYRILSENLNADNLLKLIAEVNKILTDNKDELPLGIIITHGTDTLQFSAAILSYVFANAAIPIVLVSSDYILDDKRANGLTNYIYAIEFIKQKCHKGVFVSYCNKGGVPTIHYGTRLQPALSYSGDVESIENSWLMRFIDNSWVKNDVIGLSSTVTQKLLPDADKIRLSDNTSSILRIPACPGFAYPTLNSDIKAVLHESYHSGTICISQDLRDFAMQAANLQIPIFLTGLTKYNAEYETVDEYRKLGIIPLTDTAMVAAYCKLWLSISNDLDIKNIMQTCIANDTL